MLKKGSWGIMDLRRLPAIQLALLLTLSAIALSSVHAQTAAVEATPTLEDRFPTSRWESTIKGFEKADLEQPPAPHSILFIGSSSIRMWDVASAFPELSVINRGFGGSHIADSTAFVERIVVPYRPRQIVFYAGDNDVNSGIPPRIVRDHFKAFVQKVHQTLPDVPIIYISIKTCHNRIKVLPQMETANQLVKEYCETSPLLTFLDVDTPMRGTDNLPRKELFLDDQLHLNKEGYALWNKLLRPLLTPEP